MGREIRRHIVRRKHTDLRVSVESAFDFSSSGPSLPGEAWRLLRVVGIPLLREDPSALDPDAPLPRRDVGGLGSLIPVL